MNKIYYSTSNF